MVKTNRRKALTLFLGSLSFLITGCVAGYVEGTEDYLKFCIERQSSPKPTKCPKQAPVDMELLIVPSEIVREIPNRFLRDVGPQGPTLDS